MKRMIMAGVGAIMVGAALLVSGVAGIGDPHSSGPISYRSALPAEAAGHAIDQAQELDRMACAAIHSANANPHDPALPGVAVTVADIAKRSTIFEIHFHGQVLSDIWELWRAASPGSNEEAFRLIDLQTAAYELDVACIRAGLV